MVSKVLQNALWGPPVAGAFLGLTLAWASTTTITVNTGVATDSTLQRTMKLGTALTKSTSAWAPGNAGGLDTGTIAANTGYHWYLIFNQTTGAVDIVYSATATPLAGPTLMPSGYTHFKWIWWTKTNASSQWHPFTQTNDECIWAATFSDASNQSLGATSVLVTMTSPFGIKCEVLVNVVTGNPVAGTNLLISSPDQNDVTSNTNPSGNRNFDIISANSPNAAMLRVLTDTQSRVRLNSSAASSVFYFNTFGWIVPRGSVR
jgi:hypothetical protein